MPRRPDRVEPLPALAHSSSVNVELAAASHGVEQAQQGLRRRGCSVPMAEILELGPDLGVELIVRLRHGLDHAPLPRDRRRGARAKAANNGDPGAAARSLVAILNPAAGRTRPPTSGPSGKSEREAR